MNRVTTLEAYEDDRGNRIEFSGTVEKNIRVKFKGRNNVLRVATQHNIAQLFVDFDCDDGLVEIGSSRGVPGARSDPRRGRLPGAHRQERVVDDDGGHVDGGGHVDHDR